MQRAYALSNETINASNKQAQDILDQATQDANDIRLSAITYTDEMLANIEAIIQETLENAGGKYGFFLEALQSCAGVVTQNRKELAPQTAQAAAMSSSYNTASASLEEEPEEEEEELDELDDLDDLEEEKA